MNPNYTRHATEICRLYQEGQPVAALAAQFGMPQYRVRELIYLGGVQIRGVGRPSKATDEQIVEAYKRGDSITKLCADLQVSTAKVYAALRRQGVTLRSSN